MWYSSRLDRASVVVSGATCSNLAAPGWPRYRTPVNPARPSEAPRGSQVGFTLVELMVTVSIVGTLAAVAIPAFFRLTHSAKTTEAVDRLAYLYRQSTAYWAGERVGRPGAVALSPRQFPGPAPLTPFPVPSGHRVQDAPGAWNQETWQALNFSMTKPHYYSYEYRAEGTNLDAKFTARALGDLDGDVTFSTFERAGRVNENLEVEGTSGLWMSNETE
jgi:prepilin-type N-terminal cleavage/methylation domain-containing protein